MKNFEDWIIEKAAGPNKTSPVVWLNRDEFVQKVETDSLNLRVREPDDFFSTVNVDKQLANIHEKGIIFLRTNGQFRDLEQFAVCKVNGVWKFSMCSQVLEDLKYKN